MAVNVLIPSDSQDPLQDEVSKAFIYGQNLLVSKIACVLTPSEGYEKFIKEAEKAPFCTLDGSGTNESSMIGTLEDTASTILQEVIPQNLTLFLKPTVEEILMQTYPNHMTDSPVDCPENRIICSTTQSRIDQSLGRATFERKENKVLVVTNQEKDINGAPTIVEAFILLTSEWSQPTFDVYNLKIEVKQQQQGVCTRMLYKAADKVESVTGFQPMHQDHKFSIKGKCSCSQFSINTSMIRDIMDKKEDTKTQIISFLSRGIRIEKNSVQSMLE